MHTKYLPEETQTTAASSDEEMAQRLLSERELAEWTMAHPSMKNSYNLKLPISAAERKQIPIYSGVFKYFPDAMIEVAKCSQIGNDQHNPGKPLHWDRSKSGDELDALTRHLLEAGTIDSDGIRHSTKVAWRALANLQKEIEEAKGQPF